MQNIWPVKSTKMAEENKNNIRTETAWKDSTWIGLNIHCGTVRFLFFCLMLWRVWGDITNSFKDMHIKIYAFKIMYPFIANGKYDYDTIEIRCGNLKKWRRKSFRQSLKEVVVLAVEMFLWYYDGTMWSLKKGMMKKVFQTKLEASSAFDSGNVFLWYYDCKMWSFKKEIMKKHLQIKLEKNDSLGNGK